MKIYLSILILSSVIFSSCKKDYACECTTTDVEPAFSNGGSVNTAGNTTIYQNTIFIKDIKKNATDICEGNSSTSTYSSPYSSYGQPNTIRTVDCQLK